MLYASLLHQNTHYTKRWWPRYIAKRCCRMHILLHTNSYLTTRQWSLTHDVVYFTIILAKRVRISHYSHRFYCGKRPLLRTVLYVRVYNQQRLIVRGVCSHLCLPLYPFSSTLVVPMRLVSVQKHVTVISVEFPVNILVIIKTHRFIAL